MRDQGKKQLEIILYRKLLGCPESKDTQAIANELFQDLEIRPILKVERDFLKTSEGNKIKIVDATTKIKMEFVQLIKRIRKDLSEPLERKSWDIKVPPKLDPELAALIDEVERATDPHYPKLDAISRVRSLTSLISQLQGSPEVEEEMKRSGISKKDAVRQVLEKKLGRVKST